MTIKIKKLKEDAILPRYAHPGDAGMDLFSNEEFLLRAGERHLYKTGISMELPSGYVSLVWDKSSLPYHHGIKSMGGVIDATYRGEYGVILFNTSQEDYLIKKGDKIAQVLIQKVEEAEIKEVSELSETSRGGGGYGSTGRS